MRDGLKIEAVYEMKILGGSMICTLQEAGFGRLLKLMAGYGIKTKPANRDSLVDSTMPLK